jgi:hypothetical protein
MEAFEEIDQVITPTSFLPGGCFKILGVPGDMADTWVGGVIQVPFERVPAGKPPLTPAHKLRLVIVTARFLNEIGMVSLEEFGSCGPEGCTATKPLGRTVSQYVAVKICFTVV